MRIKKSRNNAPGPATYRNVPFKAYKEINNSLTVKFGTTRRYFNFKKGNSLSLICSCSNE